MRELYEGSRYTSSSVPSLPMRSPSSKMPGEKETAGPGTPTEHGNDLPTPILNTAPNLVHQAWYSGSNDSVITLEQLERLRDLSLTESKAPMTLERDAGMSGTEGKATLSIESPRERHCPEEDDEEQSSPGILTPASEAQELGEEVLKIISQGLVKYAIWEALKGPLYEFWQEWLGGVRCCDSGGQNKSSSTSSSAAGSNSQSPQKSKGKRVANAENEDAESEFDERPRKQQRPRNKRPFEEQLACPFFKSDPKRYMDCCREGFSKVSYVKTHIYIHHYRCPRCHQSFGKVQQTDDHIAEGNCEPAAVPYPPDGITPEGRLWLGNRVPSGRTEEEQWFHVYDHFLSDRPRPRSAYNSFDSFVELFNTRDSVGQSAEDTFLQELRQNPAWTPGLEAIARALNNCETPAATQPHETGQGPAVPSSSQEPGASFSQPENHGTAVPSLQPEPRLSESSNSSGPEVATLEGPGEATSAIVQGMAENEEPQSDSAQALASADYEQEQEVNESDQPPPQHLIHGGNSTPAEQQWPYSDLLVPESFTYDPHGFIDDILDMNYTEDDLFGSFVDIGGSQDLPFNLDFPDTEEPLPLGEARGLSPSESPVGMAGTGSGDESVMEDGKMVESGNVGDIVFQEQHSP